MLSLHNPANLQTVSADARKLASPCGGGERAEAMPRSPGFHVGGYPYYSNTARILSLRPTKLQASSADERKPASSDAPGGGGAERATSLPSRVSMARALREFLAEDASQSAPGSPSSPLARSPLVRVAQRWQRAKLLGASSGLEEWARVRTWSARSEALAAETMQEFTTARTIIIGGRPVFLEPDADVKCIQPFFPSLLAAEEPPRLRRLHGKHSDMCDICNPGAQAALASSASLTSPSMRWARLRAKRGEKIPSAPYDAVTPERGATLRMPFAPPTAPPVCLFSESFSGTTQLFCATGESRAERFASSSSLLLSILELSDTTIHEP